MVSHNTMAPLWLGEQFRRRSWSCRIRRPAQRWSPYSFWFRSDLRIWVRVCCGKTEKKLAENSAQISILLSQILKFCHYRTLSNNQNSDFVCPWRWQCWRSRTRGRDTRWRGSRGRSRRWTPSSGGSSNCNRTLRSAESCSSVFSILLSLIRLRTGRSNFKFDADTYRVTHQVVP